MICRAEFDDRVILVGHNPLVVFASTREHTDDLEKGDDGHYQRADLKRLADEGHGTLYDEQDLMAILIGLPRILGGCLPVD
jgi:hypothetical protein